MKVTYGPVLTVIDFTAEDKLYRVEVRGEKVIDFSASSGWTITKVSVTRDRRALVLTMVGEDAVYQITEDESWRVGDRAEAIVRDGRIVEVRFIK